MLENFFLFIFGLLPLSRRSMHRDVAYLRHHYRRFGAKRLVLLPDGFYNRLSEEAYTRVAQSGHRVTIGRYQKALDAVAAEAMRVVEGKPADERVKQIVDFWAEQSEPL